MYKLKYTLQQFRFLKVLFSPFKPFKLKLYVGKTAIGVPYFLPRKWVKATPERAHKATLKYIKSEEKYNENNPKYARKIRPYQEVYEEKMRCEYAVPLKIGFSYCGLGWKTKWTDKDFRYEWNPILSFVFFGYQIAISVSAPKDEYSSQYWEAWLYYEYETDRTKSKRERMEQCRKEFQQTWTTYHSDGRKRTIDYYKHILKRKYI